jgi:hypothetical protein
MDNTDRATLDAWLPALAAALGSAPAATDDQGVCVLDGRDHPRLRIALAPDRPRLLLSAVVQRVPDTGRAALFRRLLEWNLLGQHTDGAVLALDPDGGDVLLCFSCPMAGLDAEAFVRLVQSLLEVATRLRGELARLPPPAATPPAGAPPGAGGAPPIWG